MGHAVDGAGATVVLAISQRFPERTVFTRFITPQHAEDMPGTWRLYYEKWRQTTRERLDVRLLQLMPDLAKLAPPATVIDKTRYSAFSSPFCCNIFARYRQTALSSLVLKPMFACWRRSWAPWIMDTA
jgi:nicotinamidase-related amidase